MSVGGPQRQIGEDEAWWARHSDDAVGPAGASAGRTDHQVLVSIAQLLEEVLAEVKRTNAHLGEAKTDRTSVKIETGAKRELKATTHLYAGDADQAANTWLVEEAIRIHQLAQAYCDEGAT